MDLRDTGRQHAIARHHVEDAYLPEQRGDHYRRVPGHAAEGNDPKDRRILRRGAHGVEHRGTIAQFGIRHRAHRTEREHDVQDSADPQGEHDADRHMADRIGGFFGCNGDRVESDVGIKHERGARDDAMETVRRKGMKKFAVDR